MKGGASDTDPNDGKNHQEDRKAMWATLKNMIGADVMSVFSVPVFIMEPMSTLQKMAEILQYQHLLDEAADEEDEDVRLALVTNPRWWRAAPFGNPVVPDVYWIIT